MLSRIKGISVVFPAAGMVRTESSGLDPAEHGGNQRTDRAV